VFDQAPQFPGASRQFGRGDGHVDPPADNQVQRLLAEGVPEANIKFDDGKSGKLRSRPARDELLGMLREDDILVVTKLDRIGRSLINLVDVISLLRERGVQLGVLDGDIDTTTPTGKFFFHVNAAMAEWVAAMTREHSGPVSNEWRQKAPALLTNAPKRAGR